MPLLNTRVPQYDSKKPAQEDWNSFRSGLNTLLNETEINKDELAQSDNIVLKGKGVPTKRAGYKLYFLSDVTGAVRGLGGFYKSDGTNELVAVTDNGYLTIKSNASYTARSGVSWASGYNANMAQIANTMYIVNGQREMVKYSSPTLVGFPTIAIPSGLFATQISGASGTNTYSYRVSAVSNVGETLASGSYLIAGQPQDLTMGTIKTSWSAVSTASAILQAYNIYGRTAGNETFLGSVLPPSTTFLDDGSSVPAEFTYPPTADSTGGINAKYILRFEDRLVFAGLSGEGSKVVISGRVPNQEKFDLANGGNFIRIEPDAGDDVTGLAVFRNKIVVFKQRSIWQISLSQISVGNFVITQPTAELITASHGCIAPKSIANVENDIVFLGRKGVYVLGYEPNIAIDVLRSNELSVKIRPFFDGVTTAQKQIASAVYFDFKYRLSFPGTTKTIVYDRERTCWLGPWTYDTRTATVYTDSNNDEVLIMGDTTSSNVYNVSSSYSDDNGSAIATIMRTRSEDFGDWTVFKTIQDIYLNLRNVTGDVSIDISLQDRDGNAIVAKSFSISSSTGNAGWGSDLWGSALWGNSNNAGGGATASDLVEWIGLYKTARRIQITVRTSGISDNYELLGIRLFARPIGRGLKGSGWQI